MAHNRCLVRGIVAHPRCKQPPHPSEARSGAGPARRHQPPPNDKEQSLAGIRKVEGEGWGKDLRGLGEQ